MRVVRRFAFLLAALPAAAAQASDCAPAPASPRPEDAQALVQCVLQAHVDERARIPAFVVTYEGQMQNADQSLTAVAPFERYPGSVEIGVDGERLTTFEARSMLPGGFDFRNLFVQEGDGPVVNYDRTRRVRTDAPALPGSIVRLDPIRLARQLASAQLAWIATAPDGTVTLRATREGAASFDVRIEPATARIVGFHQTFPPGLGGAVQFDVTLAYDDDEPRFLPLSADITLRPEHTAGTHNVLKRTAFRRVAPRDAQVQDVARFPVESRDWRPARNVQPVSPRAWLLRNLTETTAQWSYNSLVVKTAAGWWILEAPVSADVSAWVMQELEKLSPGTPIAGVVQSHHHHDHLSGIAPYLTSARRMVSTPATATFLRARFDHATTEAVATGDTLALDDGTLRVFALADPHAGTMLVTYLPAEKTLFQADLLNLREYPDNAATNAFRTWLRGSGLAVSRIAGVHGDVLEGDELQRWMAGR